MRPVTFARHARSMRFAVVGGTACLVVLVVRFQMQPPEPQILRSVLSAAASSGAVDRGRQVYARYGCAQCHGDDGKGGFSNPNAETDSQVPGVIYVKEGYTAQELRRKILDGVLTVGKGDPTGVTPPYRMPGWAGQMTDGEVTDLVQYLVGLYPKSADDKWR